MRYLEQREAVKGVGGNGTQALHQEEGAKGEAGKPARKLLGSPGERAGWSVIGSWRERLEEGAGLEGFEVGPGWTGCGAGEGLEASSLGNQVGWGWGRPHGDRGQKHSTPSQAALVLPVGQEQELITKEALALSLCPQITPRNPINPPWCPLGDCL